ncbi:hypothetical protein [Azospirillum soli]|uniref:hypothetical protein n=1 Tax=Azospirillum soli TaxID=1304799 RepID=UPI001AE8D303|nr:hypothetical protein [Azospirillum soli]MBP2314313.1 hypothetical protein [Azospirillum soli]
MMRRVISLVWVVVVALAGSPLAAQEQQLPPFDVFVYMDASKTIFTERQPGPNRRIVEMLKELFREPIDDKRPFVGAGDRVYLYTFAEKAQEFSKGAIDGGNRKNLEAELDRLGSEGEKGHNQGKTDIGAMLGSVRGNPGMLSDLGKRQKVVLIASDFVDDTINREEVFCRSTREYESKPELVPARSAIEDLRRSIIGLEKETSSRPFIALLEMDEPLPSGKPDKYPDCTNRMMRLARIQTALSDAAGVGAVRIPYSSAERSSRNFIDTVKSGIYRAMLPPLDVVDPRAEWRDNGIVVRFSVRNRGRIPNALQAVQLHREPKGLSVSGEQLETPRSIAPDDQIARELFVLGDELRALTRDLPTDADGNQKLYLSVVDESRAPNGQRRTYPVPVENVTPLVIKSVTRTGDGRALQVEFANDGGATKTARSITFFSSSDTTRQKWIGIVPLKDGPRLEPGMPRKENIALPDPVIQNVKQGDFWITVDTGPEGQFRSAPYRVQAPNLNPIVIEGTDWVQISNTRARLLLDLNNPNALPIAFAKLALYGDNQIRVDYCEPEGDARVVKGQQSGRTTVTCDLDVSRQNAVFDQQKLWVRLVDEADRSLSGDTLKPLRSLRREPLSIQKGEIRTGTSGNAVISLQVKNPNQIYTLVRQVSLRNVGRPQSYIWTANPPKQIAPGDPATPVDIDVDQKLLSVIDPLHPVEAVLVDPDGETTAPRSPFRLSPARVDAPAVLESKGSSPWGQDAPRLTLRLRNNANVPQRPEMIALSSDPVGGNQREFEIEQKDPLAPGEEAERTVLLAKPEDQARFAGVQGLFACVSQVAGSERHVCADQERRRLPSLPAPLISVTPNMEGASGLAYNAEKREIKLRLTNNGEWAGQPKAVWFLPLNRSTQGVVKHAVPDSAPWIERGKSHELSISLSNSDWEKVFSPAGIRLQPYAVVGDVNTSPPAQATDVAIKPVEKIALTIKGTWLQKTPSGDRIAARVDVNVVRSAVDPPLPAIFVVLLDGDQPIPNGRQEARVTWQGNHGHAEVPFPDVKVTEAERGRLTANIEYAGIPEPMATGTVRAHFVVSMLAITYPGLVVLALVSFYFLFRSRHVPAYLGKGNLWRGFAFLRIDESQASKAWEWGERVYTVVIAVLFGGSAGPSAASFMGADISNILVGIMITCSASITLLIFRRLFLLSLNSRLESRVGTPFTDCFTRSIMQRPWWYYWAMSGTFLVAWLVTALFVAPITSPMFVLAWIN